MSSIATVRRVVAILLLTLWWGGFSFYAGRVVFIGHQVLKSKIRQGFITERVTAELNWLAVAAMSNELLQHLPSPSPVIVEAFLTQYAIRKADPLFARTQRVQLVSYLRS